MKLFSVFVLLLFCKSVFAQIVACTSRNLPDYAQLSGNHIIAPISSNLSDFAWIGQGSAIDRVLRIAGDNDFPSIIFSQGLWFSGLTAEGDFRSCGELFGNASGSFSDNYYHGPLNLDGTPFAENCNDFNRVWEVRGEDILSHIADYADDGIVDQPIANILGWPGKGNQQFEQMNGFQLPVDRDLAPFIDFNNNDIYEPLQGEYPVEPHGATIPQHMTWNITNTLKDLRPSNSDEVLIAEIHSTYWAYYCTQNNWLDYSIFASHNVINSSSEIFSDAKVGIWSYPDFGCYADDLIGCDTTRNCYFFYNADNDDDENCGPDDSGTFGQNPPVQSVQFLNRNMNAFTTQTIDGISQVFPMRPPSNPRQFYFTMDGFWIDGQSIFDSGDGFDEGTGGITKHIFHGNPTIPGEWSMLEENIWPSVRSGLGSTNLGEWLPGESVTLDVAYSFHRSPDRDFLGNVELMYDQVDHIQAFYDGNFNTACQPAICEGDCVWPGDLNNDGIANHVDLVAFGFGRDESGSERNDPIIWQGFEANSWPNDQLIEGAPNSKHLDADGDGTVTDFDFEVTTNFYGSKHPAYQPVETYIDGFDLQLQNLNGQSEVLLESGSENIRVLLVSQEVDLKAVAFSIDKTQSPIFIDDLFLPFLGQDTSVLHYVHINSGLDYVAFNSLQNFQQNLIVPLLDFEICRQGPIPDSVLQDSIFLKIKNATGWLSDGTEIDLGSSQLTVFLQSPTSSENISQQPLKIFPNPVINNLSLEFPDNFVAKRLIIFDHLGRIVLERKEDGCTNELSVAHLPAGSYSILASNGRRHFRDVFIKSN